MAVGQASSVTFDEMGWWQPSGSSDASRNPSGSRAQRHLLCGHGIGGTQLMGAITARCLTAALARAFLRGWRRVFLADPNPTPPDDRPPG